ncbi:fasciclin domain-containing protein [Elysia marginata]|uniref:Fasciclin domain-containing protein n=1 Tax=Elysia marginata TaxID=1093978 RepID=A0AAV4H811_9GAST|nr:fasciclin domain-containing protein [Elysia marginata]
MSMEIEKARHSLAVRMLSGGSDNPLVPIPETVRRLGLVALDHLLQISGLNKTLEGKGPYTLFAPNDVAFKKMPEWAKKAVSNKTVLIEFLAFHVLSGVLKSGDLKNELVELTAQGERLRINIYDRRPLDRTVITAQCAPIELERVDKPATNGLIHVLEGVMIPPGGNAVIALAANPNFKTLVRLVKIAGLVETLAKGGPFTVFAPNDDAFAKVPKDVLAKLLKDKALLTSTAVCCVG